MRELTDQDAVWHTPGQGPLAGDYRGIDAILGFFARIAERPALVPEMDALAGDAELAGHLGLTDAGGEQLGGAEPTGLEPFAFSLCRRTASNGWHCLILTGGTRPHQLSRQTNTQNPLLTRRPEAEDAHGLLTGLADTTRNRAGRLPVGKQPRPG